MSVSKKVQAKIDKWKKKGYKIQITRDSQFLHRKPRNRRDMKRTGKYLGTAWGGTGLSVFAYKEYKVKRKR